MATQLLNVSTILPEARAANVEVETPCAKVLENQLAPPRGAVARMADSIRGSFSQFRADLKNQGAIRLLLAPRRNSEQFSWWRALSNPIMETHDWIRRVRGRAPLRRQLSQIVAVPLFGVLFTGLVLSTEVLDFHNDNRFIARETELDRPGAAYVYQIAAAQGIKMSDAKQILDEYPVRLQERLRTGDFPRPQEFVDRKLISTEQAAALRTIVLQAFHELTPSGTMPPGFDSHFRSRLTSLVSASPTFRNLSPDALASLQFVLWPQVKIHGHADLDLFLTLIREKMAMAGIWELANKHVKEIGLGGFLKLTQEALDEPDILAAKVVRAKAMDFPSEKMLVASRPDLGGFAQSYNFYDIKLGVQKLNDEMDRWRVILHDWRFREIKARWQQNGRSSLETLTAGEEIIHSLDQLFRLENPSLGPFKLESLNPPTVQTVCTLTGSVTGPFVANPLFAGIEQNIKTYKITGVESEYYRYYSGLLYWYYFAEDAFLDQDFQAREQHIRNLQAAEDNLLDLAAAHHLETTFKKRAVTLDLSCAAPDFPAIQD